MTASSPPLRFLSEGLPVPTPARPPRLFKSTRRAEPGGTIRLIVAGELDLAARPHFQAALDAAQADADRVLLDLRALTFLDCSGLGTVYGAAGRARLAGTVLILLEPRGQVRRLLDLVGPPCGVGILEHGDIPTVVGKVAA